MYTLKEKERLFVKPFTLMANMPRVLYPPNSKLYSELELFKIWY